MARPRAVIFDLWGTLVHEDHTVSERRLQARLAGFRACLERRGFAVSEDELRRAVEKHVAEYVLLHARGEDHDCETRFAHLLEILRPGLVAEAGEGILAEMVDAAEAPMLEMPPLLDRDAPALLDWLAGRGLRLGLISNTIMSGGRSMRLTAPFKAIAHHFEVAVFSDEAGAAKPNPAIFRSVLDSMALDAAAALFVGDSPSADAGGAKAAGLSSVLIGSAEEEGVVPDHRIARLSELRPIVERRGS